MYFVSVFCLKLEKNKRGKTSKPAISYGSLMAYNGNPEQQLTLLSTIISGCFYARTFYFMTFLPKPVLF